MSFLESGFELVHDVVSIDLIENIKRELKHYSLERKGGGIRHAEKKLDSVKLLLSSQCLQQKAASYLLDQTSVVRVILFDKTPENNWLVAWHQDKTVAVSERFEIAGWGPWSIKEGCHYVQPTLDVLNNMVTFRIHLDATTEENGCLKVIPKSHLKGLMTQKEIQAYTKHHEPYSCEADSGSALIMRPHILHSSSKAKRVSHRRVLHVEFSSYRLPESITWA